MQKTNPNRFTRRCGHQPVRYTRQKSNRFTRRRGHQPVIHKKWQETLIQSDRRHLHKKREVNFRTQPVHKRRVSFGQRSRMKWHQRKRSFHTLLFNKWREIWEGKKNAHKCTHTLDYTQLHPYLQNSRPTKLQDPQIYALLKMPNVSRTNSLYFSICTSGGNETGAPEKKSAVYTSHRSQKWTPRQHTRIKQDKKLQWPAGFGAVQRCEERLYNSYRASEENRNSGRLQLIELQPIKQ